MQLPVLFPFNPTAQVANVKQLTLKEGSDLREFIRIINADTIFANQSRTLAESRGRYFRLAMQIVIIGGQRYHNLQVQRNGKIQSTTYANVLVSQAAAGLLDHDVIRGTFYKSFNRIAAVGIETGNRED